MSDGSRPEAQAEGPNPERLVRLADVRAKLMECKRPASGMFTIEELLAALGAVPSPVSMPLEEEREEAAREAQAFWLPRLQALDARVRKRDARIGVLEEALREKDEALDGLENAATGFLSAAKYKVLESVEETLLEALDAARAALEGGTEIPKPEIQAHGDGMLVGPGLAAWGLDDPTRRIGDCLGAAGSRCLVRSRSVMSYVAIFLVGIPVGIVLSRTVRYWWSRRAGQS